MAPNVENAQANPNQKTLHVWSKAIEEPDESQSQGADKKANSARPTISGAVSMIKTEDFTNVHNTPCARQGFLTGIAAGTGIGGLRFVLSGNAVKAANWAVGMFILGSTASYEYCQYLRRAERIQMKRHIEVVSENRREQARKADKEKKEQMRLEQERIAAQRPWYKFW
ncbi:Cytochrome oxidase biogenesis protein, Cox20 subunit [Metarhizium album ARSEF 1941]|uniref:Cytochrome c oxidase assembly protein COX20, mitochondrial n=1 Tax=Metarhizium album (strain ARSEF 1941) TaxID=1081103 RepID=A0A0B2WU56_METAS|nr:Cytochrome oxidase biogenesis protein, Cox20 subunit [Metarhizium album ARSEF 1941]KHN97174.1 Cytochrome oxidase biogenesis protein, Cox20 subunit [Metarhizium album ARSEF 1941]